MSNEDIIKAVNYLKTLEPTKDIIINFMDLARADERDMLISEIETQVQAMREDGEGDLREVLSFLNSLKKN